MIVLMATNEQFPLGMACTNRIISLAKGLVENDVAVKVVCFQTTEKLEQTVNSEARGVYQGIEFEYTPGTTVIGRTFLRRKRLGLRSLVRALRVLVDSSRHTDQCVLFLYTRSAKYITFFYLAAQLLGIILVQDEVEYPMVLLEKPQSLLGKIHAGLYISFVYRLFDAILVMTKPLEGYFKDRIRKRARILRVPMTVEISRFLTNTWSSPERSRYIAYCGDVGGNKDGVRNLIEAFAKLEARHEDVKLYIIGDSSGTSDLERLQQLARDLSVQNRVVFTGRVLRNEIPRYLCNASILALARPAGLQSEGGFPSKLGEYLATGNPVVVTRVGEIPEYLTDGEDAFLVEPDDVSGFASKLDYVLSNQDLARKVGLRGMEVAKTNFDYRVQGEKTVQFLRALASPLLRPLGSQGLSRGSTSMFAPLA
jgi:glycosyltransferase involved in cell wall biosynthesis